METQQQIETRLKYLYAVSALGIRATASHVKSLFQSIYNITEENWNAIEDDMNDSDLVMNDIKNRNNAILISDDGLVVLQFFGDRIPEDERSQMDAFADELNPDSEISWERFYNPESGIFELMLFENERRQLHLKMNIDEPTARLLQGLAIPDTDELKERIIETILLTKK